MYVCFVETVNRTGSYFISISKQGPDPGEIRKDQTEEVHKVRNISNNAKFVG